MNLRLGDLESSPSTTLGLGELLSTSRDFYVKVEQSFSFVDVNGKSVEVHEGDSICFGYEGAVWILREGDPTKSDYYSINLTKQDKLRKDTSLRFSYIKKAS